MTTTTAALLSISPGSSEGIRLEEKEGKSSRGEREQNKKTHTMMHPPIGDRCIADVVSVCFNIHA